MRKHKKFMYWKADTNQKWDMLNTIEAMHEAILSPGMVRKHDTP